MTPDELKDYLLFLKSEGPLPPKEVEAQLFSKIKKALNPSRAVVIAKLFGFHVIGSVITLLFCPQHGMSIFGIPGITGALMDIHPALCFLACGLFWMLGGQALAYALLTIDEQRVLGNFRWVSAFSIVLLSVLFFAAMGTLQLDKWFLVWALGAVASVLIFTGKAHVNQRRLQIGMPH